MGAAGHCEDPMDGVHPNDEGRGILPTTADLHACCTPLGEPGTQIHRLIQSMNLEISCSEEQVPLRGVKGACGSSSEISGLPPTHSKTLFKHLPCTSSALGTGILEPSLSAHVPGRGW